MSNFGVKISLPGKDVKSGRLKDLLFHSDYPLLKIKQSGTGTVSVTTDISGNGTGSSSAITHNLGYKPIAFVWGEKTPDGFSAGDYYSYPSYQPTFSVYGYTVSTTNLVISVSVLGGIPSTAFTINFKYIIYYDPE